MIIGVKFHSENMPRMKFDTNTSSCECFSIWLLLKKIIIIYAILLRKHPFLSFMTLVYERSLERLIHESYLGFRFITLTTG